jgi:hypothetical protein
LRHWVYDLQKNIWLMNEKTLQYENSINLFNKVAKRRKLIEMGLDLHSSWVNLLLHLGMAKAQSSNTDHIKTQKTLKNLAVATGMTEVLGFNIDNIENMDPEDAKSIYMQGEKYLLGFGVAQSFDTAFKRYQVIFV